MTHVVVVAWIFVVLLVAVVEATSPRGSLLGAFSTLLIWGALPLVLLLYFTAASARVRRRRIATRSAADADRRGHAAGEAVAAEREEA